MKKLYLPSKKCEACGKDLVLRVTRDIQRKRFCSRKCFIKKINPSQFFIPSEEWREKLRGERPQASGKNNHRYIDGRASFRKTLLRSDREYKCSQCEIKKGLIAHHIEFCKRTKDRARTIIRGNHSLDNLQWLCRSHHRMIHLYPKSI